MGQQGGGGGAGLSYGAVPLQFPYGGLGQQSRRDRVPWWGGMCGAGWDAWDVWGGVQKGFLWRSYRGGMCVVGCTRGVPSTAHYALHLQPASVHTQCAQCISMGPLEAPTAFTHTQCAQCMSRAHLKPRQCDLGGKSDLTQLALADQIRSLVLPMCEHAPREGGREGGGALYISSEA